ncbi:MAG: hypothetical protein ACOC20_06620, partial [Oceanicaulis sp.]
LPGVPISFGLGATGGTQIGERPHGVLTGNAVAVYRGEEIWIYDFVDGVLTPRRPPVGLDWGALSKAVDAVFAEFIASRKAGA